MDMFLRLTGRVDELLGKRGLQNFVYEVAVVELQRRAAKYLEILSEDSLRLELALDTQVSFSPTASSFPDTLCPNSNVHTRHTRMPTSLSVCTYTMCMLCACVV